MNSNYKILIEFIVSLISKSNLTPNLSGGGIFLEMKYENRNEIEKEIENFYKLNEIKLEYEKRNSSSIAINCIRYRIYFNREIFLKNFELNKLDKDFCILEDLNNYYIYDHQTEVVYYNSNKINDNNFILNNIYFRKILELLKNDTEPDNFCTFNDEIRNSIISIIPEKGKFDIGYNEHDNYENSSFDLKLYFNKLSEAKKDFIPFFKNEVYDNLKNFEVKERFYNLIKNLNVIFDNAKNNYDLYVSGFSVQAFIDDFRIQQNKYLSSYRDIFNKIYTYSISIPVSFTATILGLLNIKAENHFALWAISISFILFSVLSIYYQFYLLKDIKLIKKEFELDKEKIRKSAVNKNIDMNNIIEIIERRELILKNVIITIISIIILFAVLIILLSLFLSNCSNICNTIYFIFIKFLYSIICCS